MGKQSRNKAARRALGKPERLADRLLNTPLGEWTMPPWIGASQLRTFALATRELQQALVGVPVIQADNVAAYYYAHPRDDWGAEDFPHASPPFETFFIEARRPEFVRSRGKIEPRPSWCPDQFGVFFRVVPTTGMADNSIGDGIDSIRIDTLGAKWVLMGEIVARWGDVISYPAFHRWFFVKPDGGLCDTGQCLALMEDSSPEGREAVAGSIGGFFLPFLLALSFLNCRNVVTTEHEPDVVINRARKRAGLRPFVRYRTINIEPMKRVLKTEGRVETHGLKKALHLVRGHFAHFSEDRPLFGRPGLYGDFWIPAHARGSIDNGLVVADYNVKAPTIPTAEVASQ